MKYPTSASYILFPQTPLSNRGAAISPPASPTQLSPTVSRGNGNSVPGSPASGTIKASASEAGRGASEEKQKGRPERMEGLSPPFSGKEFYFYHGEFVEGFKSGEQALELRSYGHHMSLGIVLVVGIVVAAASATVDVLDAAVTCDVAASDVALLSLLLRHFCCLIVRAPPNKRVKLGS